MYEKEKRRAASRVAYWVARKMEAEQKIEEAQAELIEIVTKEEQEESNA